MLVEAGASVVGDDGRERVFRAYRRLTRLDERPTEARSVMDYSVVTSIRDGDDDRDQLPLCATQRARATHDLDVEVVVVSHHLRMHAVYTDDVVLIVDAIRWRNLAFGEVANERHGALSGLRSKGRTP